MARIKPQALLLQSKKKKAPSGVSVPTIIVYILIVAVMVFSLFSTYKYWASKIKLHSESSKVVNFPMFLNSCNVLCFREQSSLWQLSREVKQQNV
ncbi:hypothetical protein KY289_006287 [Solanum tuberosum]|nr:hypothetical protein KY289_006287 [Solanum tuberosum]